MKKWKAGTLKMGKTGKTVPTTPEGQKVAEAIMFSERSNEAAHGGEYVSGSEPAHVTGMRKARKPRK